MAHPQTIPEPSDVQYMHTKLASTSSRDPKEIVCSLMQLQNYFTFLKTVISYWHNDATIIYIYIYIYIYISGGHRLIFLI